MFGLNRKEVCYLERYTAENPDTLSPEQKALFDQINQDNSYSTRKTLDEIDAAEAISLFNAGKYTEAMQLLEKNFNNPEEKYIYLIFSCYAFTKTGEFAKAKVVAKEIGLPYQNLKALFLRFPLSVEMNVDPTFEHGFIEDYIHRILMRIRGPQLKLKGRALEEECIIELYHSAREQNNVYFLKNILKIMHDKRGIAISAGISDFTKYLAEVCYQAHDYCWAAEFMDSYYLAKRGNLQILETTIQYHKKYLENANLQRSFHQEAVPLAREHLKFLEEEYLRLVSKIELKQ